MIDPARLSPQDLLQLGRAVGNRSVNRLLHPAGVTSRGPTVSQAHTIQRETRTAPQAVSLAISPSDAVVFRTGPVTIGDLSVHFTGRMAVQGQGVLVDEELPVKNAAAFLKRRVREQLKSAFDGAKANGTSARIELALGGETLVLELAPGAEKQPAFQVAGRFVASGRGIKVAGAEIGGGKITLDATAWISPTKPPAPATDPAAKPTPPGDASVSKYTFAGQEVRFLDDKRSGSVSLKSDMDDFDARLPDIVKQHAFLTLPEQRAAFFQEMRAYFGTDAKTIDHFAKMRKVAVKGAGTVLHEEAALRLEAVQAEVTQANMPSSGGVGWPRSECSLAGNQSLANLHNLGFAIDYNAYQAPHIKDQRILDLIQITTGRSASLDYSTPAGIDTRATGETATRGSEEDKEKLAADAKVQTWLEGVEKEAAALGRASDDFRSSLKGKDATGTEIDHAPKLQELRSKWFAATDKVAAAKKKERGAKKDAKAAATAEVVAAEAERKTVQDELRVVLKPWLDKVLAQKTSMEAKIRAVGLDPATLPTGKALVLAMTAAQSLAKRIDALAAKLGGELRKGQRKNVDDFIRAAKTMLTDTASPAADDAAAILELERLGRLVNQRHTALQQKKWLDRVVTLHTALTDDPSLVFGDTAKKQVADPALAQLVDTGYFNLKGQAGAGKEAFGPDFVKSMIKHGFTHGGTWSTPDFMHFELRWKGPGQ